LHDGVVVDATDDEPILPAGATAVATSNHREQHTAWKARHTAKRDFRAMFLDSMHTVAHRGFVVIRAGIDLGIASRTIPEIFDLLEAKYGGSDTESVKVAQQRLTDVYTLERPFEEELQMRQAQQDYLERVGQLPSPVQLYLWLKNSVKGIVVLDDAVKYFEHAHAPAEYTYANLSTHLLAVSARSTSEMTAQRVINQATAASAASSANYAAEDTRQSTAEEYDAVTAATIDQLEQSLGSRTLSKNQTRKLVAAIRGAIKNELEYHDQDKKDGRGGGRGGWRGGGKGGGKGTRS
jgi:hypothetical protein